MKKKITMVLAGLGLCASMMVIAPKEVEANPCVYQSRTGSGSLEGSCYGSVGSCIVNICLEEVIVQ